MGSYRQGFIGLLLSVLMMGSCMVTAQAAAPAIYGKLVFHRYSDYEAWDSRLYIYNFYTQQINSIGANWAINHSMNGHFSPDGKWLTFMGVQSGQHYGDAWDIYVWRVGSSDQPINLTQGNNQRDEDPKFLPDGQRIVFKQNGDLKIIRVLDKSIAAVTSNGWATEESMPYPLAATTQFVYAKGARSESRIYMIDQSGAYDTKLTNIASYYPVSWKNGEFLYSRWYSASNTHDQVYSYNTATKRSTRLPFNSPNVDTSDATPLDSRYLVVSRHNGHSYDLYIADSQSIDLWALPINSTLEELGADFTPY